MVTLHPPNEGTPWCVDLTMNNDQKTLARIMFHNKILRSDAQAYEDLFVWVLGYAYPDFAPVKPQGQIGDQKNDGYLRGQGVYYQVYAPEDLKKSTRNASEKLKDSFDGLKEYWDSISQVREFYMVFNDKFRGAYPEVDKDLAAIKTNFGLDKCACFLAKDLESLLFTQPDDIINVIAGYLPNPENIKTLDYSILNEVIGHIMDKKRKLDLQENLTAPDFSEKIKFNGLGPQVAAYLNNASYQVGILEDFFSLNSAFPKQALRDVLRNVYLQGTKAEYGDQGDQVFMHILNEASPKETEPYESAVLVLMAYYFEACDIFEDPPRGGS